MKTQRTSQSVTACEKISQFIVERNRSKYFVKFDCEKRGVSDLFFEFSFCLKLVPLQNISQENVFYLQTGTTSFT